MSLTTKLWNTLLFGCAALALGAAACGESTSGEGSAKGDEEAPLVVGDDSKLDSFRKPTEHGELFVGDMASAVVKDGQVYHAWTFNLTASADIVLDTQVSKNLDTVMYLYYREDSGSSWGKYIAKNDDYNEEIRSRIERKEAAAGEYRVIVKPYKTALRGDFSIGYECSGAGCKARFEGMTCSTQEVLSSRYDVISQGCLNTFEGILSAPIQPSAVAPDCVQQRVLDAYVAYWGDLGIWEELADGQSPEEVVSIGIAVHGSQGYVATASAGGDEDTLYYVLNANGEIVMFVHSEQSPVQSWSCAAAADKELDAAAQPSEDCTLSILNAMEFTAADLTESKRTTGDDDALSDLVKAAVDYAEASYGIDPANTQISYEIYDTYQNKAFTARTVIGDPMEPQRITIYTAKSSSPSVEVVYSVTGDGDMDKICN